MNNKSIYLAIVNITSWAGIDASAEHVYGNLILSKLPNVTIDNVQDYSCEYLGEKIELKRPLTLEIARALDEKEGGNMYQRIVRSMESNPEFFGDEGEGEDLATTNRFDTFEQVVTAGILKWRELNIDCPLISLYHGEKYKANSFEPSDTIILQYGE